MSLLLWIVLLIGVLTWPQMTLCVLLFWHGYPVLGVIAVITSFFSGKDLVQNRVLESRKI